MGFSERRRPFVPGFTPATGTASGQRFHNHSPLGLWFPSPPEPEQRHIVSYIEKEGARMASLRAAAERSITLLKERRATLIAAAVTGQISVEAAV